jgi:hypothetical protein
VRFAQVQPDALAHRVLRIYRVGIRQAEGAAIGLEGGVRPVALVLHLEDLAREPDVHGAAAGKFVPDLLDVEERLARRNAFGEPAVARRAVAADDLGGRAGHALDGVQDDEPGAVGLEFAVDPRFALDRHLPVARSGDGDRHGYGRAVGLRGIVVAERMGLGIEIRRCGAERQRAPVAVADDEGDRAHGLRTIEGNAPQLAAADPQRQPPACDKLVIGWGFGSAEDPDRALHLPVLAVLLGFDR